jgi:hypothetical protein
LDAGAPNPVYQNRWEALLLDRKVRRGAREIRDQNQGIAAMKSPFIPIDAECFICHARADMTVALPNGVHFVCETCFDKDTTKAPEAPERELFCPVCGMETTIVSFDANECGLNSSDEVLDYILGLGPYSALCRCCYSFLRTTHHTPEAALDYWRDYAQTAVLDFSG